MFAGFDSTHYSLYVYGVCKKCMKKLNNKIIISYMKVDVLLGLSGVTKARESS